MGCFNSDMSIGCLLQDGPTLTPSLTYLDYLTKHFDWNVKEIKKLKKYSKLAERLETVHIELLDLCHKNVKVLNSLNFDDERTIVHGDLNASNILIDPASLDVTAILDWEFASLGFDDTGLDFFTSWFENVEMKEKIKNYVNEIAIENKHNNLSKEVRKHFYDLNSEATQLVFHVSSWFYEAKKRGDTDLEVRRYIDRQANILVVLLEKTPFYMEMIKNLTCS